MQESNKFAKYTQIRAVVSVSEQMEIVNEEHSLQMSLVKKILVGTESPSRRRSSTIALGIVFV